MRRDLKRRHLVCGHANTLPPTKAPLCPTISPQNPKNSLTAPPYLYICARGTPGGAGAGGYA